MFVSGSILNHEKYEKHENGKQKLRLGSIEKSGLRTASFLTTNDFFPNSPAAYDSFCETSWEP